jgi:hypothetical protein
LTYHALTSPGYPRLQVWGVSVSALDARNPEVLAGGRQIAPGRRSAIRQWLRPLQNGAVFFQAEVDQTPGGKAVPYRNRSPHPPRGYAAVPSIYAAELNKSKSSCFSITRTFRLPLLPKVRQAAPRFSLLDLIAPVPDLIRLREPSSRLRSETARGAIGFKKGRVGIGRRRRGMA